MRLTAAVLALATLGAAEVPEGARFGLYVATLEGREVVAMRANERFVPASNTKLFTTIAAFETLSASAALDGPDVAGGAAVRLEGRDVVLVGHGDARLSGADDCVVDCLATLADAVAARTRMVRDVIGDDSAFADERWSQGMSWNNIATRSGTAVSALTLDDNEAVVTVAPGSVVGDGYHAIEDRVSAGAVTKLSVERAVNARTLRVSGTVAAGSAPVRLRVSVDDPAHRAAWRLAEMLRARGVRVTGAVSVRHRPVSAGDAAGAMVARVPAAPMLARVVPGALAADIAVTNKASQNLHAELLLRRLGSGSVASGLGVVEAVAARAGVARTGWDLSDGSGMSTYNRVTPRAMVTLLRWAAGRPWGDRFRATLPVAGVDGTLRSRFRGTSVAGRLRAKTGTLNAANALAGYVTAKSGAVLVFAAYVGDMPGDVSATAAIDAALVKVAEAN